MSGWEVKVLNGEEAQVFFDRLKTALSDQRIDLFRSIGAQAVKRVQHRIVTQDDGRWAPVSKWIRAKTGQEKALLGTEKFIRFTATRNKLRVVGHGGKWTHTQHDEGFQNELESPTEKHDERGRVVLKIKDARPIAIYQETRRVKGQQVARATVFAFKPKRRGRTPARKIWDTPEEVLEYADPIASRWLEKVVMETGGSLVRA